MVTKSVRRVFPRRLGERLCLDFANTVDSRIGPDREDFLRSYADLVLWGGFASVLAQTQVDRLVSAGARHPEAAAAVLGRAIELREAIFEVFQCVARAESPVAGDLDVVQQEHLAALAHARLVGVGARFDFVWGDDVADLDRVLWPIVRSAVDLLLTGDPARVRQCWGPAGDCGWLFYDVSKNASRRWCSMEGCGSQAKMRRYRARGRVAGD